MKKILSNFSGLLLILTVALSGCAFPGVYNHYVASIEGRVIDKETKQPIEGVLVKASWRTEVGGWAGSVGRKSLPPIETLTNADGHYKIVTIGNVLADGYISEADPYIDFFKSGYLVELKKNNYLDHNRSAWYRSSDWDGKTIELKPYPVVDVKYVQSFNAFVRGVDGGGSDPCHLVMLPLTFKMVKNERLRIEELVELDEYIYDIDRRIGETAPSALHGFIHHLKKCEKWEEFEKKYYK